MEFLDVEFREYFSIEPPLLYSIRMQKNIPERVTAAERFALPQYELYDAAHRSDPAHDAAAAGAVGIAADVAVTPAPQEELRSEEFVVMPWTRKQNRRLWFVPGSIGNRTLIGC